MSKKYSSVHITIKLSSKTNQLLSESAERSHRKKVAEARLRLEDHLNRYQSISEIEKVVNKKRSCKDVSCIE